MRMWGVDPKLMCQKHLGGEHVEMHMFLGTLRAGKSIAGYIAKGLVEVHNIINRHNELAREMSRRGLRHVSAVRKTDHELLWHEGHVDVPGNVKELQRRCKNCSRLIEQANNQL